MLLRLGRLRTVLLVFVLAVSMFGVGLLFTRTGPAQTTAPAGRGDIGPSLMNAASRGDLAEVIASLQQRLDDVPGDHPAWAALATAYVQQAAVTGDPSYYPKAEAALSESLALEPATRNAAALTGQAALAAALHDFETAARYARESQRINPYSAINQGVLTDALNQLGRYDQSRDELQKMLDLQPAVPSFTRAAYAFELEGNLAAARQALKRALKLASRPSDQAYCLLQLGDLSSESGFLTAADQYYERGLKLAPDYPALTAGRAKVAAARGDTATAIDLYEDVIRRSPVPGYLIEYAEFLRSAGRDQQAARQEKAIDATRRLLETQGNGIDLDFALFDANNGRAAAALEVAKAAWKTQRNIEAADVYAWALHANNRDREALEYAKLASRLGTKDALFAFHRGAIELALGKTAAARRSFQRTLAINPQFSPPEAPRAEAALRALRQ